MLITDACRLLLSLNNWLNSLKFIQIIGIGRFGYGLGYNYNNDYLGLGLNSYGLGSGLSDGSIFGSSFYPGLDGFRLPYLSYPLKYKQSKSTRLDDQKKPKSPFD